MYPSGEFFEVLKFPAGANLYLGKGLVTSNKIEPQVSNLIHALYFFSQTAGTLQVMAIFMAHSTTLVLSKNSLMMAKSIYLCQILTT